MLNNIHESKEQISTLRKSFSKLEEISMTLVKEISRLSKEINKLEANIEENISNLELDDLLLSNFEYEESEDTIELTKYIGTNKHVIISGCYKGKRTLITRKFLTEFQTNGFESLTFKEKDSVKALVISEKLDYVFIDCYGASTVESIDLRGLDTSNVTNMDGMFSGSHSLISLNLEGLNTSNVVNMSNMFSGCRSLRNLDLSSFDTSKVKYMSSMFEECVSLDTLDLSNFNTKNVEIMRDMFKECSNLEYLNLSNFVCNRVDDSLYMFDECDSLGKVVTTDTKVIRELESDVEILKAI
jgi:surface protein